MAHLAFAIFQQHGNTQYDSGMAALREFAARVLPDHDLHYVVVDNALPAGREFLSRADETIVSGDNSGREFSGFDTGIRWCAKHLAPTAATPVVIANDTFHRSYGSDYLARFTSRLVREGLDRQGIVGHVDAYPEEASLLGYGFRRWIRTSLFVLPYAILQRLGPLHRPFSHAEFFREDADPLFFADGAPLSEPYRRMLRTWLFAAVEPGALFAESWHSKQPLSVDNVERLRDKSCAIFCEHLLSARAEALGVPLFDINAPAHRRERRRHVVVVDHYVPQPDRDAGSRTMVEFMRALIAGGNDVTFFPANGYYDPEYTPVLTKLGVRQMVLGAGCPGPADWFSQSRNDIDAVLLSRPDVADSFLPIARQLGVGPVMYYGHDIHWQRMHLQESVTGHQTAAISEPAERMRRREEAIWRSVDVVLYPSLEEADSVRSYLEATRERDGSTARVVRPYSFTPVSRVREWASRRHLLFVAGFGHPPNIDAARWLCDKIMPLVWHKLPDTTLQIVGSHPTAAVKALRSSRVEVAGTVTEQELHQRYADSLVAVVPLRVGAGVKNKVLEAMAHGIPVVTTSIGVQGLAPARDFCAVSDSADGFAESILELVHSPDRWTFASEAGRAFVGQEFSPTAMERHWAQLLDWAIETHRRPKVHLTHGR